MCRGEPNIPPFSGMENFGGIMMHSNGYECGDNLRGKKAVVVGCCNSGACADWPDHPSVYS